jgi:regulator of protease activity HflC (stomatin/prohibitin superfamily)
MPQQHPMPYLLLVILSIPALWLFSVALNGAVQMIPLVEAVAWFVGAVIISASLKIADQWERAVVLRLGKFTELKWPGLFFYHTRCR